MLKKHGYLILNDIYNITHFLFTLYFNNNTTVVFNRALQIKCFHLRFQERLGHFLFPTKGELTYLIQKVNHVYVAVSFTLTSVVALSFHRY